MQSDPELHDDGDGSHDSGQKNHDPADNIDDNVDNNIDDTIDPESHKKARELQVLIMASREIGATEEILAALTDVAGLLVQHGKTTEAANLLAYILHHADVPYDTYDRADDLWIALEAELCPRVIADAREQASYMTLRGIMDASFEAFK